MQGRPGVPRLALGGTLSLPAVDAPASARPPACVVRAAQGILYAPALAGPQLHVSLLSPAFELSMSPNQQPEQDEQTKYQQQQPQAPWADEAAARLGVDHDRLRFYGIVEARSPSDLPPGCSRVAVEIADARFSLPAMEGVLREMAELRKRQELLQAENTALRHQLRSSESLRRKGSQTLAALQDDFKSLCAALVAGGSMEDARCDDVATRDCSPAAVSAGHVQLQ